MAVLDYFICSCGSEKEARLTMLRCLASQALYLLSATELLPTTPHTFLVQFSIS